jgi:predicted RNA methylase
MFFGSIVAVVGAGRGPLVSRALRAAQASGRAITLFAVEKNPNAYVHLLRHNRDTWNGQVTVIKSDMRSWNPPFTVDIMISELLGSFGDNELSPECLDGVQRVLNRKSCLIPFISFDYLFYFPLPRSVTIYAFRMVRRRSIPTIREKKK